MSRLRPARIAAAALMLGAVALLSRAIPAAEVDAHPGAALLAHGDSLRRAEAYRSAEEVLTRVLADARATGNRGAESDALAALARVADGLGDTAAADRRRAEALTLASALGDRRREARALSDAGAAAWMRAEYPAAEAALRRARDEQQALGDARGEALTLLRLGRIPFKQGRYDEALELYARALALREGAGDLGGVAETEIAIGLVHLDRRAYSLSMDAFRRALVTAELAGDVEQRIFALDHIAIAWMFQDAPGEARAPLEEALRLARAAGSRPLEMKVRHLVANVDRQAGRYHAAIAAYEELAAYCEGEGNLREAAWNRARLAKAAATLGRLENAKQSYREAIATWERLGDRRPAAFALYDLARLLDRCGETDQALATYERARAVQHAIALPYESLLLSDLALLEARRGRIAAARRLASEAVDAADAVANPEMRWIALSRRAKVLLAAGREDEAWLSLAAALEAIETLRAGIEPSDEAKAGFMEDKQEVYSDAVDLLVERGQPGLALEVSERARARALLDLLAAASDSDPSLVRVPGSHLESPVLAPPPTEADLRAEARRLGATILEYSTGTARSVVLAIGPGGQVQSAVIAADAPDLARRIAALRRALEAERDPSSRAAGTGVATALLRDLYSLLVAPVAELLPAEAGGRVVIVPHGPLFLLPFACLVAPDGSYLVERYALSYAPSVGILRAVVARRGGMPRRSPRVLAVGGPRGVSGTGGGDARELPVLPGAEAEARDVAGLFTTSDAALLTGAEAREDRVRELAPGRSIIHIAAHAVVREDAPLESYLALAATPGADADTDVVPRAAGDGRLTAREVLALPLEADLVVLSGCQTGLGAITGDGVSGLSRAFLSAGAASLVVSLWRVADVVGREVMARFQRELHVEGEGTPEALRRAQLSTIESLRRGTLRDEAGNRVAESPLLWAPFVLVGEPVPRAGDPGGE